jgi:hypothetical protein
MRDDSAAIKSQRQTEFFALVGANQDSLRFESR